MQEQGGRPLETPVELELHGRLGPGVAGETEGERGGGEKGLEQVALVHRRWHLEKEWLERKQ